MALLGKIGRSSMTIMGGSTATTTTTTVGMATIIMGTVTTTTISWRRFARRARTVSACVQINQRRASCGGGEDPAAVADALATPPSTAICNIVISVGTDCGGADPDAPTVECTNTCQWANDDYCDDTRTSGLCDLGTDCHDCGPASKGNFTTFDDDGWWDDDENYWDDDYDWF